ncbi:hypothetical protein AB0B63_18550 [Micromonospora sp. NPDC049081]|uniref:hypothetical protein n=1 Tax=Micromonospora sp. NPDC049081 TaxID=3155150 RepID=UPI0033F57655
MTATLGQAAITITDRDKATLTVERNADGRVSAWIAAPGFNDGHSILLDEADAVSVAAFLTGRVVDLLPHLVAARRQAAVYANEIGRLKADMRRMQADNTARDAVVEAATVWRAQFTRPPAIKLPRQAALIDAVDALPTAVNA